MRLNYFNCIQINYISVQLHLSWKSGSQEPIILFLVRSATIWCPLTVSFILHLINFYQLKIYNSYLKCFFVEYDHQIEMIGIPRLTFLKNGKCGKCNYWKTYLEKPYLKTIWTLVIYWNVFNCKPYFKSIWTLVSYSNVLDYFNCIYVLRWIFLF